MAFGGRAARRAGVLALVIVVCLPGCGGDDGADERAETGAWVVELRGNVAAAAVPANSIGNPAVALLAERLRALDTAFRQDPRDLSGGAQLNLETGLEALNNLRDRLPALDSALRDAAADPTLGNAVRVRDLVTLIVNEAESVTTFLDLEPEDELGRQFEAEPGCDTLRELVAGLDDPPSLDPTGPGGPPTTS